MGGIFDCDESRCCRRSDDFNWYGHFYECDLTRRYASEFPTAYD